MALGVYGTRSEKELAPELQELIAKNRPYFEWMPVDPADVETESESE